MSDTVVHIGPVLAVAVVLPAIVAVLVAYVGRTGREWAIARASVRATIQLGLLALVLGVLVRNFWASAGFILVMSVIAAWTAAGRRQTLRRPLSPHRTALSAAPELSQAPG